MTPDASDAELIRLLAGGHLPAFGVIFDHHREAALALATTICGSTLGEEAVQDAFMQVCRAAQSYRPELGSVRGWMLGIVRHRAIDALRRDARHVRRRADAQELERLPGSDEVATVVERRERAQTVRILLGSLPQAQAQVLKMAYFDELTHTEIAAATGLPVGTVKGRIRLGLSKLRQPLAGERGGLPPV